MIKTNAFMRHPRLVCGECGSEIDLSTFSCSNCGDNLDMNEYYCNKYGNHYCNNCIEESKKIKPIQLELFKPNGDAND